VPWNCDDPLAIRHHNMSALTRYPKPRLLKSLDSALLRNASDPAHKSKCENDFAKFTFAGQLPRDGKILPNCIPDVVHSFQLRQAL
jgi:hypothetical protein